MADEYKKTLKEMCAEFDVTPRTIRYYEYIELLSPERAGRTRYYGPKEVGRLKLILRGRRFGFSLERLRQWLELYETTPGNKAQADEWERMASQQIEELTAQRDDLSKSIEELKILREKAYHALSE